MRRRLVLTAVTAAALGGFAAPSFASSGPVTVHVSTTNGVSAGVGVEGQNVVGATVSPGGEVCGGISQQVPICV